MDFSQKCRKAEGVSYNAKEKESNDWKTFFTSPNCHALGAVWGEVISWLQMGARLPSTHLTYINAVFGEEYVHCAAI